MTKTALQKELLEKVKLGTKPSDLKKQKEQENINTQIPTPPDSPVITPIDKKPSKKPGKKNILPPPIVKLENKKIKEPVNKTFFCDNCQITKTGIFIKRKVDAPFEPRLHGKTCYLCSSCSPYVKELNDTTFDKDNNPYKIY